MIIATLNNWAVGSIHNLSIEDYDRDGNLINEKAAQPFKVIRNATVDEWIADNLERCGPPPTNIRDLVKGSKFYEIHTD